MESAARPLTTDVVDGVATITFTSAATANSMTPEWGRCFRADIAELAETRGLRVIVLRAEGRAFCVGGDIGAFASAEDPRTLIWSLADDLHRGLTQLASIDAPVLAAVQGPAAGAGLSLVCGADIVIAGRSAFFSAAYTAAGLSPDGGMSWLLPRLIGTRRATEMLLTNRRVGAEEAATIGLVTETVDDDALEARTAEVVAQLVKASTSSLGATRRLLRAGASATLEQQFAAEAAEIARLGATASGQEGLHAFLERREPRFES